MSITDFCALLRANTGGGVLFWTERHARFEDLCVSSAGAKMELDLRNSTIAPDYKVNLLGPLSMWRSQKAGANELLSVSTEIHTSHDPFGILYSGKGGSGSTEAVFTDNVYKEEIPIKPNCQLQLDGMFASHRCEGKLIIEFLSKDYGTIEVSTLTVPAEIAGGGDNSTFYRVQTDITTPVESAYLRVKVRKGQTLYGNDSFIFFSHVNLWQGLIQTPYSNHLRSIILHSNKYPGSIFELTISAAANLSVSGPDNVNIELHSIEEVKQPLASLSLSNYRFRSLFRRRFSASVKNIATIGIVLYTNSDDEVARCLENVFLACKVSEELLVKKGGDFRFDVVVLDNTPDHSASDYGFDDNVFYYKSSANLGFGGGHNLIMKEAFDNGASYYIGLNPDGYPKSDCLYEMIVAAESSAAGIVEAQQFPNEHPKPYDTWTGVTEWCSGAAFLLTKNAFEVTEGFDPNIAMYCEDVELSWRIRNSGLLCILAARAIFFHDVRPRTDPLVRKNMLISGLYLAHKWRAPGFVSYVKSCLVKEGFYPEELYIPHPPQPKEFFDSEIPEWRQEFVFAVPRWRL